MQKLRVIITGITGDENMNPNFYINMAEVMLPRPTRRYCKPILQEDNKEMPIILVSSGEDE